MLLCSSFTLVSIFARRSFCCFSMSVMAVTMSLLNESRVDCAILPLSNRLSNAFFFLFASSYSSFSRLNECFHEINFGHLFAFLVLRRDNVC